MTKLFDKKIVFISGASAGFGESCAHAFAAEGADLVLLARRQERLADIAQAIGEKYVVKVQTVAVDVCDRKALFAACAALPDAFATPDILINNAGLARALDPQWENSDSDIDDMIDTNIKGLLDLTRALVPKMLQRGSGHVINVSSISGHLTYVGGAVYCATKHAVRALTDSLRKELVDSDIRVSMISPGLAETEYSIVRFKGDAKKAASVYDGMTPLSGQDVADAIIFMASRPQHVTVADMILLPTDQADTASVRRRI